MTTLSILLVAALFGSMVFFPSVVAPLVFKVLDEERAGAFLRALFPRYFAYLATLGAAAAVTLLVSGHIGLALLAAALAISAWWSRNVLTPAINDAKDGKPRAGILSRFGFDTLHRASVAINLVQLAISAVILIALV